MPLAARVAAHPVSDQEELLVLDETEVVFVVVAFQPGSVLAA